MTALAGSTAVLVLGYVLTSIGFSAALVVCTAAILGTFYVDPRVARDFIWAWWSRLFLFFGVAATQAYLAFFLIKVLHFTPATVAGAIFLCTLTMTATAVVFALVAARISDRLGRRKPFVVASALIYALGLALVATSTTFPALLGALAVTGVGQGAFFAVDIALVTQVLPDPANPGKDLGIMHLGNTLPFSLAPAVAPLIVAIGATAASPQNFSALFLAGAIAGLLGALLVLPVRSVR